MTGQSFLGPVVAKEIRALLPIWAPCLLAVAAGALTDDPRLRAAGILAFGFGSLALGAQSIGHEHGCRTLALLLAQPVERWRLLLVKIGVLTVMLVTLGAAAWAVLSPPNGFPSGFHQEWVSALLFPTGLVALCSLCVAPVLTMVSRSPLAGVVLTVALPFSVMVLGDALGIALYGADAAARIDAFRMSVFWRGMFAICAICAALDWRLFMRLEVLGDARADVHLPGWLRVRALETIRAKAARARSHARPVRKHALLLLVRKELRLQQLTFVVVALYVGYELAGLTLGRSVPQFSSLRLSQIPLLTSGLFSMLIGSLASAEERSFGTIEWHVMLPMAAWRQWAVKAGVVVVLTLLVGIGVPAVLGRFDPGSDEARFLARMWREAAVWLVVLAACSVYVSSLCASGTRALVLMLPVVAGGMWFVHTVSSTMRWVLLRSWGGSSRPALFQTPFPIRRSAFQSAETLVTALAAVFVLLLLRFALTNHTRAEKSGARLAGQAASIAGFIAASALLLMVSGIRF